MFYGFILLAILITIAAHPLTKFLAFRLNILDHPEARKIHVAPIPRLGGLSIFLGFVISSALYLSLSSEIPGMTKTQLIRIILCSFAAFVIGFIDDVFTVGSKVKLVGQILLSCIMISLGFKVNSLFFGPGVTLHTGFLSSAVTIFWIVGIMNAVNLIDGMDGLASGTSTIALAAIAGFSKFYGNDSLMYLALIGMGCCIGFLKYNFHPAKIFMGDGGSMFLGFLLAVFSLSIDSSQMGSVPVYIPILILAFPIVDTTVAIVRRMVRTILFEHHYSKMNVTIFLSALKRVLEADGDHIHHRLLKRNMGQRSVAFSLYFFSITCATVSFIMLHLPIGFSWLLGLTTMYGIYHWVISLDYDEFTTKQVREYKQALEEDKMINPSSKVLKKAS